MRGCGVLLAIGLFILSAEAGPVPPSPALGYHLVFADDFKHFDLSPDGRGEHAWYEGVWFNHRHAPLANIAVTNEGLDLIWTRGQDTPDTSISTFARNGAESHSWRYGYFEVRMKWNPVRGAWPAVWLVPAYAGHLAESGELDVFEGNGDNPQVFNGTIHDWKAGPDDQDKMQDVSNTGKSNRFSLSWGTDLREYHTYGMLWEPDKITWFFDNKPLHSEPSYAIFGKQNYCLIIGMQEGADWKEGNLDRVTSSRMDLNVQWARVWQK